MTPKIKPVLAWGLVAKRGGLYRLAKRTRQGVIASYPLTKPVRVVVMTKADYDRIAVVQPKKRGTKK